jgi:hypothetical protein
MAQGNIVAKIQQNALQLSHITDSGFVRKIVEIRLREFVEMDDIVNIPPLRSFPVQEGVYFLGKEYGYRTNPYHPIHIESVENFQIRSVRVILSHGIYLYKDFFVFEARKS